MRFNLTFISSLFLASVALADRHKGQLSSPFNEHPRDTASNDSNHAGAIISTDKFITFAVGDFTVPVLRSGGSVSLVVAIDSGCKEDNTFVLVVWSTFEGTNISWEVFATFADDTQYFPGVPITSGHVVRLSLFAYNTTAGYAVVENISTNLKEARYFHSSAGICSQAGMAEWGAGKLDNYPLADFGEVIISNAEAGYPGGEAKHYVTEVVQNGKSLTHTTFDEASGYIYVQWQAE